MEPRPVKLSNLLKGRKSSADLAALIADTEAKRAANLGDIERLTTERAAALLDADDATVDRLEAELQAAYRMGDRLDAVLEEAKRRQADATAEEERAAEEAMLAKAEAAAAEAEKLIATEYVTQAKAMAKLMQRLADLDAIVDDANRRLDTLKHVRPETWITPPNHRNAIDARYAGVPDPIHRRVVLPHPHHAGGKEAFWNRGA